METLNGIMMLSKEFFEKSSLHQQISTLAQGTGKFKSVIYFKK